MSLPAGAAAETAAGRGTRPRVGINLLYLRPWLVGGTEVYARHLLEGLHRAAPPLDFLVMLNRAGWESFAHLDGWRGFRRLLCASPLRPQARHLWEQSMLPLLVKRHRLQLLHSPGYVVPLAAPCAQVVTIHDVLFKVSPGSIPWLKRIYWRVMIPFSLRAADAVLTLSEDARKDVLSWLGTPAAKVHVTSAGPGQYLPEGAPWEAVRSKYVLPERFYLCVGAAAHKRLDLSAAALGQLRRRYGMDAALVVTGPTSTAGGAGSGVYLLGHVPSEDLVTLYCRAIALVSSSEMEGFGMSVLEAMTLGTPVIAARRGSLAEVLGDAGLLVEHGDVAAMAEAMARVAGDAELRARLSAKGKERALDFSWDECARRTLEVYATVLSDSGARDSGREAARP